MFSCILLFLLGPAFGGFADNVYQRYITDGAFDSDPVAPLVIPNINKITRGVDALHFSIYNDTGTRAQIFQTVYTKGGVTTDGIWRIPDGMIAVKQARCSLDSSAETYAGGSSFVETLSTHVEVEAQVGFWFAKAKFQASADYQHISKGATSNSHFYTRTALGCILYTIDIQTFSLPPFTSQFLYSIRLMKNATSQAELASQAQAFVEKYGTHFYSKASLGGKYMNTLETTAEQTARIMGSSTSLHASAQMCFLALHTDSHISKEQAEFLSNNTVSQETVELGTVSIESSNTTAGFEANWLKALLEQKNFTIVDDIQLNQINTLLGFDNLENINSQLCKQYSDCDTPLTEQELSGIQIQVDNALRSYCIRSNIPGVDCNGPSPDTQIPAPKLATLTNLPTGQVDPASGTKFSPTIGQVIGSLYPKELVGQWVRTTTYVKRIILTQADSVFAGIQVVASDILTGRDSYQPQIGKPANDSGTTYCVIEIERTNRISVVDIYTESQVDILTVTLLDGSNKSCGSARGIKESRHTQNLHSVGGWKHFVLGDNQTLVGFWGWVDSGERIARLAPVVATAQD